MSGWVRTPSGWAMNLDGTDGSRVFTLPRLELQSSGTGWRGLHFLADGRRREWACAPVGSLQAVQLSAVAEAQRSTEPPDEDGSP